MGMEELLSFHKEFIGKVGELGLIDDLVDFKPYINAMAKYLPNRTEALMRFSTGLQVVADQLNNKINYQPLGIFYQTLSSLSAIQAVENGLDLNEHSFLDFNTEQQIGGIVIKKDNFATIEQASLISKFMQRKGKTVGMLHGHFRLLTPSSIAFIINAHKEADYVLVGVEKGHRTQSFKGKDLIFTDEERALIFRKLLPFAFLIDESVEYSNKGYQRMLREISPNIYFGQSDNQIEQKEIMKERATRVRGCRYAELKNLPGLGTSRIYQELTKLSG
jgi:glycerol-3-phosphate cytidylyltransferase-like family protein